MRRAARVDDNQKEIISGLRCIGASVQPLHAVGSGCPDILVGYRGQTFAIEIKDGKKAASETRLTPDQERWHSEWKGHVAVAKSLDDALKIIGAGHQIADR